LSYYGDAAHGCRCPVCSSVVPSVCAPRYRAVRWDWHSLSLLMQPVALALLAAWMYSVVALGDAESLLLCGCAVFGCVVVQGLLCRCI
jgi:hypothetical protein